MASFEKINYSNRPSKHIERKILIHLLFLLSNHQYDITKYKYVGFGSIYFLDHILFHKYLNITKLVCLEKEDIPNRMEFNRPFDFIELQMVEYSDYLPSITNDELYLIWADYDTRLTIDSLDDIGNTIGTIPTDSIFILSFNADRQSYTNQISPFLTEKEKKDNVSISDKLISMLMEEMEAEFDNFLILKKRKYFSYKNFPKVIASIINEKVQESMSVRKNESILQFINYVYKDGAMMISMGWIIGSKDRIDALRNSDFVEDPFVVTRDTPFNITVPPLTIKEKSYIDSMIEILRDKIQKEEPVQLGFELSSNHLKNYLEVYKYYPEFRDSYV